MFCVDISDKEVILSKNKGRDKKSLAADVNTYLISNIRLMKKSTENVHDIQQLQSHPLFSDCEFVPLDQNHVLL